MLDICGGDVTVTAGSIDVALALVGDVTQRADSHYQAHWTVGDCRSSIVWADGFGGVRQGPLVVARNTGGYVDLECGGTSQRFALAAETLTFDGNTVRWSIPSTGSWALWRTSTARGRC